MYITGILQKTLKLNSVDYELDFNDYWKGDIDFEDMLNNLSSKQRSEIYKTYFDLIERFLEKDYKYLNKYLKELKQFEYNEVILTNWEILQVQSMDHHNEVERLCAKLGLVYQGEIKRNQLSKLDI